MPRPLRQLRPSPRSPSTVTGSVEAESVYWDDLRRHPKNGWSLFGLAQSLRAQNKMDEAKHIEADFKKAWADADVQLTASRF